MEIYKNEDGYFPEDLLQSSLDHYAVTGSGLTFHMMSIVRPEVPPIKRTV